MGGLRIFSCRMSCPWEGGDGDGVVSQQRRDLGGISFFGHGWRRLDSFVVFRYPVSWFGSVVITTVVLSPRSPGHCYFIRSRYEGLVPCSRGRGGSCRGVFRSGRAGMD